MEKNIISAKAQKALLELAEEFEKIHFKFKDLPTEEQKEGIIEQEAIKTIVMQILTNKL